MNRIRIIFIIAVYLAFCGSLIAQEIPEGKIKSVRLHREEWNLSYPIIELGSDQKLVLHFDLLGNNVETYYYSFIHCDKDWNPTGLFESEYLGGYTENQVDDYKLSFNTTVNYIHYKLTFPNRDVIFKISGNYIVKVYPFGEPDKPVIMKRFMISENSASIKATVMRSKLTGQYLSGQQIDFSLNHSSLNIIDPYNNIYSAILKNGRWDNARKNLKPDFTGNNTLEYNSLSEFNIFPGGNEYRYFDIKSLRYLSEYVQNIDNIYGIYHVKLTNPVNRSARQYFYWQDFNGKYYIAHQEGLDHHTDADYVYVYFSLPSKFPVEDDLYVFGELSNWSLNEENKLIYNSENNTYECRLLLKQGWYNYMYASPDKDALSADFSEFEGNFFETENDYIILSYYSDPNLRYHRLIGHKIVNTLSSSR